MHLGSTSVPRLSNIKHQTKGKGDIPNLTYKPKLRLYIQENEFLGQVDSVTEENKSWNVSLHLNDQLCQLKLNTGADVRVIT